MSSSLNRKQTGPPFSPENATVSVHALSAGHFTLPEYQFVHPVAREARKTVPSLAFLIQHHNSRTGKTTRITYDLGLRRDTHKYAAPIQKHMESRQPLTTEPNVVRSLARGGLAPADIDYVLYSHVHWDHVGEPSDFPSTTFLVGNGSLSLLNGTSPTIRGGHSFFEPDLLPKKRTIELSDPAHPDRKFPHNQRPGDLSLNQSWRPYKNLPQTLDIFNDSSVLIVNAVGHLPGHVNVLAQVSETHQVYLGGDSCHDRRLLTGEKEIGEWDDAQGDVCCIHANRKDAEETIERIRQLEREGVEIIFAHDVEWENNPDNKARFFGVESSNL